MVGADSGFLVHAEVAEVEQFLFGFLAWFATGVDDTLVLTTLLVSCRSGRQRAAVALGTCLGVAAMLALASVAPVLTKDIDVAEWGRLLGLVPFGLGVKTLFGVIRPNDDDTAETDSVRRRLSSNKLFVTAMVTYLGNSLDDLAVMTSLLLPATVGEAIGLVSGNMLGCVVSIVGAGVLAKFLSNHTKGMTVAAGVVLILIGIRILAGL